MNGGRRFDADRLRVDPDRLEFHGDAAAFPFASTAELEPLALTIGQERALAALRRGLALTGRGFNIFASGVAGSGKTSTVARLVRALAPARPRPPDRLYVYNYLDPQAPRALTLPSGAGLALQAAMAQAVQTIGSGLYGLLRSGELRSGGPDVVAAALEPVRRAFPPGPDGGDVRRFVGQVQNDLLGLLHAVLTGGGGGATAGDPFALVRARLALAEVNLLADRSRLHGAPVVVENDPTPARLFGVVEPAWPRAAAIDAAAWAPRGAPPGEHAGVRGGSLLEADGGYLIMRARDVVSDARMWQELKRVLRSGQLVPRGERDGDGRGWPAASVHPQPLALDVKVILVGEPRLHQDLYDFDPDFRKVFKITADFDAVVPRTPDNLAAFAQAAARLCHDEALRHLEPGALAELVGYGARRAEGRGKLAAEIAEIADVIREASAIAGEAGRALVSAADVRATLHDRRRRAGLVEERFLDMIADGEILLDTDGAEVGRVNGLSIYDFGYHRFGKPTRITASVAPGEAGLISIEREARLSGSIYDKGVLVISGYLRRRFARQGPLAITASLAFEQSYAGVDGDSASVGEVVALLSEIAGLPVLQGVAVTGSINQHGEVQPVGGVNEKIEGFWAVCRRRGLTGAQGVVIPERNVASLVLSGDVAADVRAGRFHLWTARTVDDAVEVLLDLPRSDADARIREGLGELRARAAASPARDQPPPIAAVTDDKPPLPGT